MNKEFYTNTNINLDKLKPIWDDLYSKCNFTEIMWLFRNITYDQIKYFSENDKGIIYTDDEKYSQLTKEQATNLQRQISTCADLFTQAVVSGREQDKNYLKQYDFAGPYLIVNQNLRREVEYLTQKITELNQELKDFQS